VPQRHRGKLLYFQSFREKSVISDQIRVRDLAHRAGVAQTRVVFAGINLNSEVEEGFLHSGAAKSAVPFGRNDRFWAVETYHTLDGKLNACFGRRLLLCSSCVWETTATGDGSAALRCSHQGIDAAAHSVHEMKKALARRCEDEKLVKSVVERLKAGKTCWTTRGMPGSLQGTARNRASKESIALRGICGRGACRTVTIEVALKNASEETDPAAVSGRGLKGAACFPGRN